MKAMLLDVPGQSLRLAEQPIPTPGPHQLLLRVHVCGVCRTDLHIVDGEVTACLGASDCGYCHGTRCSSAGI